ncbi:aldo/keto reductase [Ramlibacter albus]|uniref:Aldo/keto reductase n=1 Tax=Ramlibacter albus TaxID=2079448 RepID=A0A923MBJ4_9BURK|nr:aldo/keto reductase [Ramlibacter albus]MBC5767358.1 aldo/keto reductase [Ramlibacter albus]
MRNIQLGRSDLQVTPICLGTMTFGEQVAEPDAHAILDRAIARGINFIDTAEMYSVPARKETFGATETIIGNWLTARPGMRQKIVLATKVAGPSRGMPWVRSGSGMTGADIIASCEGSLRRLKTDAIDLYQIHWPERNVPMFGALYFDPAKDKPDSTPILEQLEAMGRLVKEGKIRWIGLSNETPYGLHEFVRIAEQHGLPRVVTVQNPYCLVSRGHVENGLDETMHRLGVSLLAYSPLAFGLLTGKYDVTGLDGPKTDRRTRLGQFQSVRDGRWGRADALSVAKHYNNLARKLGMTPTQMALAFCYTKWQVASTIIGVTSLAQLEEDIDAWGTGLSADVLAEIDKLRWDMRDPAH